MKIKRFVERVFGQVAFGTLLLSMSLAAPAWGQSLEWVREAGGDEFDFAHSVAVDEAGNTYVTGSLESSVAIFGRGEDHETVLRSDVGGDRYFFLAKYAQNGNLLWAKGARGMYSTGRGIALDGEGNIYVTGYFEASVIFGSEEDNETELTTDDEDLFVVKYDEEGQLLWAVQAHNNSIALDIDVDEEGNSYVTGYSRPGSFGSDADEIILDSSGVFVAKYASDGSLLWVTQANGGAGQGIDVDEEGHIYVTGSFSGTAAFGPDESDKLSSFGEGDIFLVKYSSDGSLRWARQAGGESDDEGTSIALDDEGNSYLTGSFAGEATFGSGEDNETVLTSSGYFDIFVAKYASDGSLLWAKRAGSDGRDSGNAIAVDAQRNSYVTGYFTKDATFGPGEDKETVLTTGGIFVAKYAENGRLKWAFQEGDSESSFEATSGRDIVIDDANIYVTGTINGPATFGSGDNEITIGRWEDNYNIFLAKYSIISTEDGIQDLIEQIKGFDLNRGIERSLIAKLRNVQKAIDSPNADRRRNAANLLEAFINEVEAQSGKHLTENQADQLIEEADQILDEL